MNAPLRELQHLGGEPVRIASITPLAGGQCCVHIYEAGHSAASEVTGFSRAASLKMVSTVISPSVAKLRRLARSYDGRRLPLKINDKCGSPHSTKSAKADCVMRPSIQDERQCGLTMAQLCHWQSPPSSPKVCYQAMELLESPNTIGGMPAAATKERKLYLKEWLTALGIKAVDLAGALDKGESHISNLGKGRRGPSIDLLLNISEKLGVTVNDLYAPPPPAKFFEAAKAQQARKMAAQALELYRQSIADLAEPLPTPRKSPNRSRS